VTEAADGVEAVKSVKRSVPDLILMDFAMPRMNGIDAAKAIRKFKHAARIPILCVTAYGRQINEDERGNRFSVDLFVKRILFGTRYARSQPKKLRIPIFSARPR
jgi:CheY-like chemotaxis protein